MKLKDVKPGTIFLYNTSIYLRTIEGGYLIYSESKAWTVGALIITLDGDGHKDVTILDVDIFNGDKCIHRTYQEDEEEAKTPLDDPNTQINWPDLTFKEVMKKLTGDKYVDGLTLEKWAAAVIDKSCEDKK